MFTIKFYSDDDFRQRIMQAESFTILRPQEGGGVAEITLHQKNQSEDCRVDVGPPYPPVETIDAFMPPRYQRAIIENAAGKTTEMIGGIPR